MIFQKQTGHLYYQTYQNTHPKRGSIPNFAKFRFSSFVVKSLLYKFSMGVLSLFATVVGGGVKFYFWRWFKTNDLRNPKFRFEGRKSRNLSGDLKMGGARSTTCGYERRNLVPFLLNHSGFCHFYFP